jgi:hypothetical protein
MLVGGRSAAVGWLVLLSHHPSAYCRHTAWLRLSQARLTSRAANWASLSASYMVGDRSGRGGGPSGGCRTVLVETGRHTAPPRCQASGPELRRTPCATLAAAAKWILGRTRS